MRMVSTLRGWLRGEHPIVPARFARPIVTVAWFGALAAASLVASVVYHHGVVTSGRLLAGAAFLVVFLVTFVGLLFLTQALAGPLNDRRDQSRGG